MDEERKKREMGGKHQATSTPTLERRSGGKRSGKVRDGLPSIHTAREGADLREAQIGLP